MTNSQLSPAQGGSRSRQHRWRRCSSTTRCGPVWSPPNKQWFDRSGVRWLESHSTVLPCPPTSRFDPQCFQVLLLRRLWCSLPLSSAFCRCGQPLDSRGHHRATCARTTRLPSGVCREAGARVSTNISVQDLDLLPGVRVEERRLEVFADGSPQSGLMGLRGQCATTDGAVLAQARRRKEHMYPELTGEHGHARLVACETGGRWSDEAHDFLRQLARARARSETTSGGAQRCPVAQHRPSRCLSWNAEGVWAPTVQCLAPVM